MVGKSKIIILSIFIFSLAFILSSIVFPKLSLACQLVARTFYQTCYSGKPCTYVSQCGSGEISAYEFGTDLGGCVMAYAAGQYYAAYCSGLTPPITCSCYGPEARWYTSPSYNGQICKRRSGIDCGQNIKEGVWDSSDSKCIVCNGVKEASYFDCSGDYGGDSKCESACGADSACDEKYPNSYFIDICETTQLKVNRYCDGNCKYYETVYTCDSSKCGNAKSCDVNTYYCVYDNGWKWSTTKPSNFCCSDNDCSGYDPTTHTKYVCECPSGCSLTGNSYRCKPKPSCGSPEDCDNGWCCNTITGTNDCKAKGTILSSGGKSYICDPPEGFVNSSNEEINTNNQANKKLTLFDLLINPFFIFSKSRI